MGVNIFDGSDSDLSYEQAIVLIAEATPFVNDAIRGPVVTAVRARKGLVIPEPDQVAYTDPRDQLVADQAKELEQLRAEKAKRDVDATLAAQAAELEQLRAARETVPVE